MQKMNFNAVVLSVVIGTVVVLCLSYFTGDFFATSLFPTLALLAGFIITGFTIGIITKDVTIAEPGLGAIMVSILTYIFVPMFELKGFVSVEGSDWLIILMNGVILSFAGAWVGEIIQHGRVEKTKTTTPTLEWSWIIAGTIVGVTLSIILVVILTLILGANPTKFYLPFFLSLLFVGAVVGKYSPGITIKEAAMAGFLIITIDFDIIRLTLFSKSIDISYVIGGMLIGFLLALIGGYVGEKMQAVRKAKDTEVVSSQL